MISYWIRERLRIRGLPYRETASSSASPDLGVELQTRAQELITRYRLERWASYWNEETLQEVLGTLDLLDQVPSAKVREFAAMFQEATHAMPSTAHWLDVGAKNWRYVGALASWLESHGGAGARLTGAEIDAYRMYTDLRTRLRYAEYFVESLAQGDSRWSGRVEYRAQDARQWREPISGAFLLFPFLERHPHKEWGLPAQAFSPAALFENLAVSLVSGGALVMANQGEWEWEAADELARAVGLQRVWHSSVGESLHASPFEIHVSLWRK